MVRQLELTSDIERAYRMFLERFRPIPATVQEYVAAVAERRKVGHELIVGVGIGEKYVSGEATGQISLKALVTRKLHPSQLDPDWLIPSTFEGFPTDVDEVGEVAALQTMLRYRPAPGGCSIGNEKEASAGTLGYFVRMDWSNSVFILSNNHVLARCNRAQLGEEILQPGRLDGGTPGQDTIGRLSHYVPLDFGGGANLADVALAEVPGERWCEHVAPFVLGVGEVRGPGAARLGQEVCKTGRTTGLTYGQIDLLLGSIWVRYGNSFARFEGVVRIRGTRPGVPFSLPGDSGSLVLDHDHRAVALLFAGSGNGLYAFANPMDLVLQELSREVGAGVSLWTIA